MNILLLTDEMLPGGVPRHVCDLANGLIERGMTPVVAATDGPFRARLSGSIEFIDTDLLKRGSYKKQMKGFFTAYGRLTALLSSRHFDIIHSHKRYSDLLAGLLARRFDIRHVSTCHNTFRHSMLTSHFPGSIIVPSTAVAENLRQYYGIERDIRIIRLGIKPLPMMTAAEIDRTRTAYGIPANATVFASVGQFIPSKDRETLIKAVGILRSRMPRFPFLLLIAGDGPEKEKVRRLAARLGLGECIRFLPGTSNVAEIFNMCSFGILSSIREGFGYVLLEAAGIGKPHVVTNVGGVTDFVTHEETGLLVPAKNPEALAEAMMTMLSSPDAAIEMGARAKMRFENDFAFDRFMDEICDHYTSLVRLVP